MRTEATVFIVDDDPAVTKSLSQLVELIDLKAEAFLSADEFLQAYKSTGPACLVLDVRMPGMSGLELQKEMANRGIDLPTIIITAHGEVRMVVEAMKAGAMEFLEKPFRTQELCDHIQTAVRLDGRRWRRKREREKVDGRLAELTSAEREVMDLVVAGKTNKMIAEGLGLSVRAIEDRRARLMKKLGVNSRAELLEMVTAAGSV